MNVDKVERGGETYALGGHNGLEGRRNVVQVGSPGFRKKGFGKS
jgi:hypothetical protein